MKQKIMIMMAVVLLGGCTGSDDLQPADKGPENPVSSQVSSVDFDAYILRSTTRAGKPGDLTADGLKTGIHKSEGFGVIAYYHDGSIYDGHQIPNFMYNKQVTYNGTAFDYSPIMYWPNETGDAAQSEHIDRLSFFGYAPYVDNSPSTGRASSSADETGITALTCNTYAGDPMVTYVSEFADMKNGVDLCWAKPVLDKVKPTVSERVVMNFRHATAKLNVQVNALVDDGSLDVDGNTRIYVRSITFGGIASTGSLILNNDADDPLWTGVGDSRWLNRDDLTVYDGRYDGKEGVMDNSQESPSGLNATLVQSGKWGAETTKGVKKTAVNLFASTTTGTDAVKLAEPLYVIPTGDALSVVIEYDIETKDSLITTVSDGETPGVSIPCRIKKTSVISAGLSAGKQYKLQLHLGLNSVKMDASVAEWDVTDVTAFETIASIEAWTRHDITPNVVEKSGTRSLTRRNDE